MTAVPLAAVTARDLRFRLTLPVTRVGFGTISVDPLAKLISAPGLDILEPPIVGDVVREVGHAGNLVERLPMVIHQGRQLFGLVATSSLRRRGTVTSVGHTRRTRRLRRDRHNRQP